MPALQTGHIGLNVTDLDRSIPFYQTAFELETILRSQDTDRDYAFLGRDGQLILTLWQQSDGEFRPDAPGLHHLSFQAETIEQVQAAQTRLRTLGARFAHNAIVPHAEGRTSGGIFFYDPDGIRLEIFAPTGADTDGQDAPTPGAPTCGFF